MDIIKKLENFASVIQDGVKTDSNVVETIILLPPTIVKSVNKNFANHGEIVEYTVLVTNVSLQDMTYVEFLDILPDGCTYMDGSFAIDGLPQTPTITDNTITYTIDVIGSESAITITFRVTVD